MSQTQKLDALIKKILKEEMSEADYMFVSKTDPKKLQKKQAAAQAGMAVVEDDPTDASSTKLKTSEESEEMEVADTEVLESMPTGTEIAGKISEVIDALSRISEGGKDEKHKKQAAKVMKAMESAKAALEALTAHEMMLEEKEKAEQEKEGHKHLKAIERHLGKLIKDKDAVGKIMKKMPVEKVLDMKKKLVDKPMDEEKMAKAMLKHSLKEGVIKKK